MSLMSEQLAKQLFDAISRDEPASAIMALVERGAPTESSRLLAGATPMHLAAARGCPHVIEALLPISDLLAKDWQGRSALFIAASSNQLLAARMLLPFSEVDAKNNSGFTPLGIAIHEGFYELALRIAPHADSLKPCSPFGLTPLMLAAASGNAELVAALLPSSDPAAKAGDGWTALMFAAQCGSESAVSLLAPLSELDARCSDTGWAAADFASEKGYQELAETLWAMSACRQERDLLNSSIARGSTRSPKLAL